MTILDLLTQTGIQPKRAAATGGGEYASKCPRCGGTDRFRCWPETGRWMCRGCNLSGDQVEFLRQYRDMSCPAAHDYIGKACTSSSCSLINTCRVGMAGSAGGGNKRPLKSVHPRRQPAQREWSATEATTPEELWQVKAHKLVERAHVQLLENPEQLQYLADRGLPIEAVKQYRLGWVPKDFWRSRESWGLPTEYKTDRNQKRVPKKLWIPQGVVIPFFDGDQIHRIRIRRPEGEPRYYWVPGSGNDTFLIGSNRQAFAAIESDLDGLMIDHLAGDLVGVVCIGNTTAKPKQQAAAVLREALHILVSLDVDTPDGQGRRAGAQAAKWWLDTFDQAERWPVPFGKDPGDAFKAGVDIRQWILEGLPPVFHVPPRHNDEPSKTAAVEPVKTPDKKPALQVTHGVSKNGFPFIIAPDKATRADLESKNFETAVFVPSELTRLKGMDTESAEIHLHLKAIFQGAEIIGRRDLHA